MANNDRVYEAYQGSMGKAFQLSTKERIDWIIEQAKEAERILDIGCSQGIVSLLLAKMGKKCVGIDIQPEAIDYANNLLESEYANIQNRVRFECIDALKFEEDEKFDCIIITEVIEHLQNPGQILRKAAEMIADGGIIIISTPFGLSPHPDHKATYYLSGFENLLTKEFVIKKIDFVEQWMGAVCLKKIQNTKELYNVLEYLVKEEEAFEAKELEYVDRVNGLRENLTNANLKYRQLSEKYGEANEKYRQLSEKYGEANEKYRQLSEKYGEANLKYRQLSEKYGIIKEWHNGKQKKLDRTLQELLRCYNDYNLSGVYFEQMSDRIIKLKSQNSTLIEENKELKRQLGIITNSKLGQLGIKIYQILNKHMRKL